MSNGNYDMKILETKSNTAIIELGENIQGGSDALEFSSLLYELNDKNIQYLIIDLSKVKMMNSSGLGMLVSGLSDTKEFNMEMKLADIPEKIDKLLNMTHLKQVFATFKSVSEAINTCK